MISKGCNLRCNLMHTQGIQWDFLSVAMHRIVLQSFLIRYQGHYHCFHNTAIAILGKVLKNHFFLFFDMVSFIFVFIDNNKFLLYFIDNITFSTSLCTIRAMTFFRFEFLIWFRRIRRIIIHNSLQKDITQYNYRLFLYCHKYMLNIENLWTIKKRPSLGEYWHIKLYCPIIDQMSLKKMWYFLWMQISTIVEHYNDSRHHYWFLHSAIITANSKGSFLMNCKPEL